MPIYDLKCPDCGHEFDELVSSHGAVADVTCEQCGSRGMELKPSLFASTIAGSGVSFGGGGCGSGGFT